MSEEGKIIQSPSNEKRGSRVMEPLTRKDPNYLDQLREQSVRRFVEMEEHWEDTILQALKELRAEQESKQKAK